MTEKRYTKVEHIFEMNDEGVKDNNTKIEYYYALDMIDLLNELNDENEQLKSENKELRILIDELKRQNQKLKGRLNDLGVEYYV